MAYNQSQLLAFIKMLGLPMVIPLLWSDNPLWPVLGVCSLFSLSVSLPK